MPTASNILLLEYQRAQSQNDRERSARIIYSRHKWRIYGLIRKVTRLARRPVQYRLGPAYYGFDDDVECIWHDTWVELLECVFVLRFKELYPNASRDDLIAACERVGIEDAAKREGLLALDPNKDQIANLGGWLARAATTNAVDFNRSTFLPDVVSSDREIWNAIFLYSRYVGTRDEGEFLVRRAISRRQFASDKRMECHSSHVRIGAGDSRTAFSIQSVGDDGESIEVTSSLDSAFGAQWSGRFKESQAAKDIQIDFDWAVARLPEMERRIILSRAPSTYYSLVWEGLPPEQWIIACTSTAQQVGFKHDIPTLAEAARSLNLKSPEFTRRFYKCRQLLDGHLEWEPIRAEIRHLLHVPATVEVSSPSGAPHFRVRKLYPNCLVRGNTSPLSRKPAECSIDGGAYGPNSISLPTRIDSCISLHPLDEDNRPIGPPGGRLPGSQRAYQFYDADACDEHLTRQAAMKRRADIVPNADVIVGREDTPEGRLRAREARGAGRRTLVNQSGVPPQGNPCRVDPAHPIGEPLSHNKQPVFPNKGGSLAAV